MKYKKIENHYIVRIDKGEEVIAKITELCLKENIALGSITGIGATNNVTIGLYDTEAKKYNKNTLLEPLEITSLTGNISTMDGKPYLHLHITVGNKENIVYGGHLNECFISATCELHILKIDGEMDRYFDPEIGLNLYKI